MAMTAPRADNQNEPDLVLVEPVIETIDLRVESDSEKSDETQSETISCEEVDKTSTTESVVGTKHLQKSDNIQIVNIKQEPVESVLDTEGSNIHAFEGTSIPVASDNDDSEENRLIAEQAHSLDNDVQNKLAISEENADDAVEIPDEETSFSNLPENEMILPQITNVYGNVNGDFENINKTNSIKTQDVTEISRLSESLQSNTITIAPLKNDKLDSDDIKNVPEISDSSHGIESYAPSQRDKSDKNDNKNYEIGSNFLTGLQTDTIFAVSPKNDKLEDNYIENLTKVRNLSEGVPSRTTIAPLPASNGAEDSDEGEYIDFLPNQLLSKSSNSDQSVIDNSKDIKLDTYEPNVKKDSKPKEEVLDVNDDNIFDVPIDSLEFVDDGIEFVDSDTVNECLPHVEDIKEEDIKENKSTFDMKLLMNTIVYTKKLDQMNILKGKSFDSVKHTQLIKAINLESKPVSNEYIRYVKSIKQEAKKIYLERNAAINDTVEVDQKPQRDEKSAAFNLNYLLLKPKNLTYSSIQLCKNPDFNTRLKRLTYGFLSSERNRQFLKACKPLTIDFYKSLDLHDNTINLGLFSLQQKHMEEKYTLQTTSTIPSAIAVQSLIDNTNIDVENLKKICAEAKTDEKKSERNKSINLQDIHEIRRINQSLLTAQVTPIRIQDNDNNSFPPPPSQRQMQPHEVYSNRNLLQANTSLPASIREQVKQNLNLLISKTELVTNNCTTVEVIKDNKSCSNEYKNDVMKSYSSSLASDQEQVKQDTGLLEPKTELATDNCTLITFSKDNNSCPSNPTSNDVYSTSSFITSIEEQVKQDTGQQLVQDNTTFDLDKDGNSCSSNSSTSMFLASVSQNKSKVTITTNRKVGPYYAPVDKGVTTWKVKQLPNRVPEDALIAPDILNKVLMILNGKQPESSKKSKKYNRKNQQLKSKEQQKTSSVSNIAVFKNDNRLKNNFESQQITTQKNNLKKPKINILHAGQTTIIAKKRKVCCWAREKLLNLKSKGARKHKCPIHRCNCCCKRELAKKSNKDSIELSDDDNDKLKNACASIEKVVQESLNSLEQPVNSPSVISSDNKPLEMISEDLTRSHSDTSQLDVPIMPKIIDTNIISNSDINVIENISADLSTNTISCEQEMLSEKVGSLTNTLCFRSTNLLNTTNNISTAFENVMPVLPAANEENMVEDAQSNKSSTFVNSLQLGGPCLTVDATNSNIVVSDGSINTNQQNKQRTQKRIRRKILYLKNKRHANEPANTPVFVGKNCLMLSNVKCPHFRQSTILVNAAQFSNVNGNNTNSKLFNLQSLPLLSQKSDAQFVTLPSGELVSSSSENLHAKVSDNKISEAVLDVDEITSNNTLTDTFISFTTGVNTNTNSLRHTVKNVDNVEENIHQDLYIEKKPKQNENEELGQCLELQTAETEKSDSPQMTDSDINVARTEIVQQQSLDFVKDKENTEIVSCDKISPTKENTSLSEIENRDNQDDYSEKSHICVSKKKSILSDLMEMSGISEEDTAVIPETTSQLVTQMNEAVSVPVLTTENQLNSQNICEFFTIHSFSELKYAYENNGKFYRLDLTTGILVQIAVRITNPRLEKNMQTLKSEVVDLTDDMETEIETNSQQSSCPSGNDTVKTMKTNRNIPTYVIKPVKLIKIYHDSDPHPTRERHSDLEINKNVKKPRVTKTYTILKNKKKQDLAARSAVINLDDDQIEVENKSTRDEPNIISYSVTNDFDSSDDEPLAKKSKRMQESVDVVPIIKSPIPIVENTDKSNEREDKEATDQTTIVTKKRKVCCWARGKLLNTKSKGASKHKCPRYRCNCCCFMLLAKKCRGIQESVDGPINESPMPIVKNAEENNEMEDQDTTEPLDTNTNKGSKNELQFVDFSDGDSQDFILGV